MSKLITCALKYTPRLTKFQSKRREIRENVEAASSATLLSESTQLYDAAKK